MKPASLEQCAAERYRNCVPDELKLQEKLARLEDALRRDNKKLVQDAMFDLGATSNDWAEIPDEVVERLLTLLRNEGMYKSPCAGHVLNFFEFESPRLTDRQKWLCIGFLNAHGDEFRDVFAHQVVVELRYGLYGDHLKMKKPNPQQWKDYLKMKGGSEEH
jgi:hypothetical protein